jgi:hypothetical protein
MLIRARTQPNLHLYLFLEWSVNIVLNKLFKHLFQTIRSSNNRFSLCFKIISSFRITKDINYFWKYNTDKSNYLLKKRVNLTIIQTIEITFLTSNPRK